MKDIKRIRSRVVKEFIDLRIDLSLCKAFGRENANSINNPGYTCINDKQAAL